MKAIWIRKHGGPEVLEVRESDDPVPAAGEVRIRVRAAGLNFAEVTARQGLYPDAPKPPCVLGYEGSGVVDAIGEGVQEPTVGTRVVFMSVFGAHADTVCVPSDQAYAIPPAMTFEEAAAIPVNYLTAHHMLFEVARVRPTDHVLVHMAAGGVGTAVLQLLGTVVDVTSYGTASASKHDYVRALGCDHPIDYRTKDYVAEILRLTDGAGVDVVLDPLGGPDWTKGMSILKPGGLLVAFGLANVNKGGKRRIVHVLGQLLRQPRFTPLKLMEDNRGVAGVNIGHLWQHKELLAQQLDAILRLYDAGRVRPHIHATYPFDRAADAFAELEYGKNVGKVVLVP